MRHLFFCLSYVPRPSCAQSYHVQVYNFACVINSADPCYFCCNQMPVCYQDHIIGSLTFHRRPVVLISQYAGFCACYFAQCKCLLSSPMIGQCIHCQINEFVLRKINIVKSLTVKEANYRLDAAIENSSVLFVQPHFNRITVIIHSFFLFLGNTHHISRYRLATYVVAVISRLVFTFDCTVPSRKL